MSVTYLICLITFNVLKKKKKNYKILLKSFLLKSFLYYSSFIRERSRLCSWLCCNPLGRMAAWANEFK